MGETAEDLREERGSTWRSVAIALGVIWDASRFGMLSLMGLTILSPILSIWSVYIAKDILDEVVLARRDVAAHGRQFDLSTLRWWLLVQLCVSVVTMVIDQAGDYFRGRVATRIANRVGERILVTGTSLDVPQLEDSKLQDKFNKARREALARPMEIYVSALKACGTVVTIVGYGFVIGQLSWWLALGVVAVSVVPFLENLRFGTEAFKHHERQFERNKLREYFARVGTAERFCKEVKAFALGPELIERYRGLAREIQEDDDSVERRHFLITVPCVLLYPFFFYGAQLYVVGWTIAGKCTIGEMTLYSSAIRQMRRGIEILFGAIETLHRSKPYVNALNGVLSYTPIQVPALERPRVGELGIRFVNVGFQYPGSLRFAVRGLSFHVPAGGSVAVVGENGSGKSTMIKLLAGLYQATEGTIYLDGKDIRGFDRSELRGRMGILFQDYNRYDLSLRDNVDLRAERDCVSDAAIIAALSRVEMDHYADSQANGLDTILGKSIHLAVEPSGGQWQKIGIARALLNDKADIFLFDEPTAALDPGAESRLYQTLAGFLKNRTGILVTHRLSAARITDTILVLHEGTLWEAGTHEALLKKKGRYAALFTTQAGRYH